MLPLINSSALPLVHLPYTILVHLNVSYHNKLRANKTSSPPLLFQHIIKDFFVQNRKIGVIVFWSGLITVHHIVYYLAVRCLHIYYNSHTDKHRNVTSRVPVLSFSRFCTLHVYTVRTQAQYLFTAHTNTQINSSFSLIIPIINILFGLTVPACVFVLNVISVPYFGFNKIIVSWPITWFTPKNIVKHI